MKVRYLTDRRKGQLETWAKKHSPKELRKVLKDFNFRDGMAALVHDQLIEDSYVNRVLAKANHIVEIYLSKSNAKLFEQKIKKGTQHKAISAIHKMVSALVNVETGEKIPDLCLITFKIIYAGDNRKKALRRVLKWVKDVLGEED